MPDSPAPVFELPVRPAKPEIEVDFAADELRLIDRRSYDSTMAFSTWMMFSASLLLLMQLVIGDPKIRYFAGCFGTCCLAASIRFGWVIFTQRRLTLNLRGLLIETRLFFWRVRRIQIALDDLQDANVASKAAAEPKSPWRERYIKVRTHERNLTFAANTRATEARWLAALIDRQIALLQRRAPRPHNEMHETTIFLRRTDTGDQRSLRPDPPSRLAAATQLPDGWAIPAPETFLGWGAWFGSWVLLMYAVATAAASPFIEVVRLLWLPFTFLAVACFSIFPSVLRKLVVNLAEHLGDATIELRRTSITERLQLGRWNRSKQNDLKRLLDRVEIAPTYDPALEVDESKLTKKRDDYLLRMVDRTNREFYTLCGLTRDEALWMGQLIVREFPQWFESAGEN